MTAREEREGCICPIHLANSKHVCPCSMRQGQMEMARRGAEISFDIGDQQIESLRAELKQWQESARAEAIAADEARAENSSLRRALERQARQLRFYESQMPKIRFKWEQEYPANPIKSKPEETKEGA